MESETQPFLSFFFSLATPSTPSIFVSAKGATVDAGVRLSDCELSPRFIHRFLRLEIKSKIYFFGVSSLIHYLLVRLFFFPRLSGIKRGSTNLF